MKRSPLDALEDALVDVETTVGTIDTILTEVGECKEGYRALDNLSRLLMRDVRALRRAFRKVPRSVTLLPPSLVPVKGGAQ